MAIPSAVALVLVGVSAAVDLRTRRVPNVLTFGGAGLAFVYFFWSAALPGLERSLEGWALGLALFLPLFLLGGMGAGDVKLLAAVGAWLGPYGAARSAFLSVMAGGVLALIVGLRHKYLKKAFTNLWGMLGFWRSAGLKSVPGLTMEDAEGPRLAYAVAIAAGTAMAVWLK